MKKEYTAPKIEKLDFDETATTAVISSITQQPVIEDDNDDDDGEGESDGKHGDKGKEKPGKKNGCKK